MKYMYMLVLMSISPCCAMRKHGNNGATELSRFRGRLSGISGHRFYREEIAVPVAPQIILDPKKIKASLVGQDGNRLQIDAGKYQRYPLLNALKNTFVIARALSDPEYPLAKLQDPSIAKSVFEERNSRWYLIFPFSERPLQSATQDQVKRVVELEKAPDRILHPVQNFEAYFLDLSKDTSAVAALPQWPELVKELRNPNARLLRGFVLKLKRLPKEEPRFIALVINKMGRDIQYIIADSNAPMAYWTDNDKIRQLFPG